MLQRPAGVAGSAGQWAVSCPGCRLARPMSGIVERPVSLIHQAEAFGVILDLAHVGNRVL